MGTRHLICVVKDGKYKVAQYGQWDGYLDGQGLDICNFIIKNLKNKKGLQKFKEHVDGVKEISEDRLADLWKEYGADSRGWVNFETSNRFKEKYEYLHRDCGANILNHIFNNKNLEVHLDLEFAGSSSCEWAYVINLDNDTLEIYRGYNRVPLRPTERFYGFATDSDRTPVKHFATIEFSKITKKTIPNLVKELESF